MPLAEARDHLGDVVNRAAYGGEVVYLTRRGRRVAAIVPADLVEAIEAEEDAKDLSAAKAALAEGGEPISLERLKAELGL